MAATEPLCSLINFDYRKLSKLELLVLEAELFSRICTEFLEYFKGQFWEYPITNSTFIMEKEMLEANFTRLIIKDILLTNEYTVEGLANYTGIHEDIIHDVMSGLNINPSANLLQRAIDLHRKIRRELYQGVVQKLLAEYSEEHADL